VLGLEGQIDYTAANAFLDAFATARRAQGGAVTQAIGWNAWQEVGMAISAVEATRPSGRSEHGRIGPHPSLERVAVESDQALTLATTFTRVRHWMLGEHVVKGGAALIPGTGFLELIRAGAADFGKERLLTLEGVAFERPFTVAEGDSRELFLSLTRTSDREAEARIFSDSAHVPHVTATVRFHAGPTPEDLDVDALRARLSARRIEVGGFLPQPFMDFGPRWANVVRVSFGADEALVELELPEAFTSDLASYELHPALLDMATGGAQALVPGFNPERDFLVPLLYQKVSVYAALERRIASHVRLRSAATPDLAAFDVTISDSTGRVLVVIEGFTMKRVAEGSFAATLPETSAESGPPETTAVARGQLATVVAHGILPAEGMDAFERILRVGRSGQLFASSVPLDEWLAFVDKSTAPKPVSQEALAPEAENAHRPALRTPYVAPRNELERDLAEMFRELLGTGRVGVHDDFFELGGQSLVAVRLFNKIRRKFSIDLPLSTLFEAPTVAQCAEVVASELGIVPAPLAQELAATNGAPANGATSNAHANGVSANGSSSHPVGANGEAGARSNTPPAPDRDSEGPSSVRRSRWRSLVAMQPRGDLPPFFCVAGMGGTLNNLRKLALLAGDARPFFGLQPPGADGQAQMLYTVEALAEHYIREVMTVNPSGPYLLGGYSGGGVAAFEMARKLREQNKEVLLLAFIDSYSPMLPLRPLHRRAEIHLQRVRDQGPGYLLRMVENRFRYESWNVGRHIARRMGKVMPETYRYDNLADSWVVAEQRYRPIPCEGSAILFRAREETALSLWTAVEVDEQHGWGRYLKGGVDVQICPGNHSTMCDEPNVRILAAKLREAMDKASPRPTRYSEPPSKRPSMPPCGL
jgi:thioesterase domain-containing protein